MTVSELIEKLKEMPQEAAVLCDVFEELYNDYTACNVLGVSFVKGFVKGLDAKEYVLIDILQP